MQKLEDHTPLFVRVPTALFDAAQAEAKKRRVVLRVVITDALEAWFGFGIGAEIEPSPPLASPPATVAVERIIANGWKVIGDNSTKGEEK